MPCRTKPRDINLTVNHETVHETLHKTHVETIEVCGKRVCMKSRSKHMCKLWKCVATVKHGMPVHDYMATSTIGEH